MAVFLQYLEDIGRKLQDKEFSIPTRNGHVDFIVDTDDATGFRGFGSPDFGQCIPVIENTFDQDFDFTAGSLGTEKAGFQDFGIVENKQVAFGQMVDQVVKTGIGDLFFVNKQQA